MKFRVPASVEVARPKSRDEWMGLRRGNIGASVAGALLGVHTYQTAYGLWALKSGLIAEDPEETPALERGRLLEPVAVRLLQRDRPAWRITHNEMPGGQYFVDPAMRLAATPDVFAVDPDRRGLGVVQIKTVSADAFRRSWRDADSGDVVPPLWIGVQAIVEAHLTGATWAAIGAMVLGNGLDFHLIEVPIHRGIIDRLRTEAAEFWWRVDTKVAPDPDYGRDGETIAALYAQDNGETVDLSADNALPALADLYEQLGAEGRAVDKRRGEIRAEILSKLGSARSGRLADGRLITAPTINRDAYQAPPTSYRTIRIKAAPVVPSAYEGAF